MKPNGKPSWLALFLLAHLTLLNYFAFAGNGSSGVGNASIELVPGVIYENSKGLAFLNNNHLYSKVTGNPILKLNSFESGRLNSIVGSDWHNTQLGKVKGYEKPGNLSPLAGNKWVICGTRKQQCIFIESITGNKELTLDILGSLQYAPKE